MNWMRLFTRWTKGDPVRRLERRTGGTLAMALMGVVVMTGSCGSPTAPLQPASLVPTGNLSVLGCQTTSPTGIFACGSFTGVLVNQGTGCAMNVRGTTRTVLLDGTHIGSAGWTSTGTVRPGETIVYGGGAIAIANTGLWQYVTDATWDDVRCP